MTLAVKDVRALGFGDNAIDQYEHRKIMYPGGNCMNFTIFSKILGAKKSAYMGYFGSDPKSQYSHKVAEKIGIDLKRCRFLEGEGGYTKVALTKWGDRVFLEWNKGGICGSTPFMLNEGDIAYMRSFDIVHTAAYAFMEDQLPTMQKAGIRTSYDFSNIATDEKYATIAPLVNFCFTSFDGTEEEAMELVKKIHAYGPEVVVATRGVKGSVGYDGNQFYLQKATPSLTSVDTMGCGDGFQTAFLINYIGKEKAGVSKEKRMRESLQAASDFASHVCMWDGAFGYGKPYGTFCSLKGYDRV